METNTLSSELKDKILKSSTSLVGLVCKDGVVLASDRQVTAGTLVVKKNFSKIIKVNDYLLIAWTGGVADAMRLGKILAAELRLKELRSKSRPTVKQAANLVSAITYNQIRQPSMVPSIVGSIVAGFDEDGKSELYTIEPAGSVVQVDDYDANFSSGMPYIMGLLERQYKKDINIEEGIKLATEALKASTQRDVGSGYGIDVYTITKEGIKKVISQEIEATYKDQ
jgi:proteasome beta subunit